MIRRARSLVSLLLLAPLGACGELGNGATAMVVDDGVRLEFRLIEDYGVMSNETGCRVQNPESDGITTAYDAGPDEPVTVCLDHNGALFETELSPAYLTGDDVAYIDYDYGTAGIPTVYVVLNDQGVLKWKTTVRRTSSTVQVLVDGTPLITTGSSDLSSNDIVNIGGLGSIEEAEAVATTMASGLD